ncbi:hypothetical protein LOZ61_003324 [Ophidiomyces ophidiicola]|nr:hypothetical protein LOZ61_003324 [Ophidiomyces ophidiicola]KAI1922813.1 hypothetical protein LOZ60_005528 [Ophidiomyces ophidiicola]KAI1959969.1 hypothetical protein LOZ59_002916 [Ophidiomyces ophidiicola]KAI2070122.1 hypothetical protein LOZ40_002114 [Ophidiomyces ophidiicola]KAI2126498.1 hypothetical protein LOZ31_003258 [Ophidiomyces ophidiicola]
MTEPMDRTKKEALSAGSSETAVAGAAESTSAQMEVDGTRQEKKLSPSSSSTHSKDQTGERGSPESLSPGEEHSPLQLTPSQSERMNKKQVMVIMGALCLALFLAALDMTIISTALPTIAAKFHANETSYTWMASSYLLANAACLPLWGKLSDIWGRKIIILLANILFLVGSLICALANSLAVFLVGRALQGIGGGGIIILGQICVSDLFSVRERPVYYAMFGAVWAIAGSLGPVIGGALTQKVTWRWCFYINLPVGGVSFLILLIWLKIESPKTPLLAGLQAIDWLGTLTIIGGTIMLLFGLEFGGITYPWKSATTICLIIFGVVTLGLFWVVERKIAKYPIIPTTIFESLSNIFILGVSWSQSSLFIAGAYYLPIYFQTVLGVGPILSGVYILPQVVGLAVLSIVAGFIIRKTGDYLWIMRISLVIMTLGYGLLIDLKPYASWPRIIIYQLIAGIGIGPNFQAPLIAIQSVVKPSDVASATSTFGFTRQLSTSTSLVFGSVVFQNVMKQSASKIREALGPELAPAFLGTIAGSNIESLHLLNDAQKHVVFVEYTHALSRLWVFYTVVGVLGCLFSLGIKKKELSQKHEVTKTGLAEQERARKERIAEEQEKKRQKAQRNGAQREKQQEV